MQVWNKAVLAAVSAAAGIVALAGCASSVTGTSTPPRTFTNVAYVGWPTNWVTSMADYTLSGSGTELDGKPFFDSVVLFAANINSLNGDQAPNTPVLGIIDSNLGESNPKGGPNDISWIGPAVEYLHSKGLTVQLSILPNHQANGWSCSATDATGADVFAKQVAAAVKQYNFDGISIDDEYAQCEDQTSNYNHYLPALQTMVSAVKSQPEMQGKTVTESVDGAMAYQFPTIAPSLDQIYTEDYAGPLDVYSYSFYPGMQPHQFFVGLSPYDPDYDVTTNGTHCGANDAQAAYEVGQGLRTAPVAYGGTMIFDPIEHLNGTAGQAAYYTQVAKGLYGDGAEVTYNPSAPQPPSFQNHCSQPAPR